MQVQIAVGLAGHPSHAKVLTGIEVTGFEFTAFQVSIDAVISVASRRIRTTDIVAPSGALRAHIVTVMGSGHLEGVPLARRALAVVDPAVIVRRVVVDPSLLNVDRGVVSRKVEEVRRFSLRALSETEDHGDHDHEKTDKVFHFESFG